jgi:hypothetical protein
MIGDSMDIADTYEQVRRQPSDERRAWLRLHAPKDENRANWWWSLLDRAQADVARPRDRLTSDYANYVLFAVDLIKMAMADGMPAYLGASWMARIARSVEASGNRDAIILASLDPDNVARRILATFQLSQAAALAAAARRHQELLTDDSAWIKPGETIVATYSNSDPELSWLQEIEYLMPDLALVESQITDGGLAETARSWLALRDRLEVGQEVAQHGRELLAQWRDESSGSAHRRIDGNDE